jgi:hypothetical protein
VNTIALAMAVVACCSTITLALLATLVVLGLYSIGSFYIRSEVSSSAAAFFDLTLFPATFIQAFENGQWLSLRSNISMETFPYLFGVLGDRPYYTGTLLIALIIQAIVISFVGMYFTAVVRQSDYIIQQKWYFPVTRLFKLITLPFSYPKVLRDFYTSSRDTVNQLMSSIATAMGEEIVQSPTPPEDTFDSPLLGASRPGRRGSHGDANHYFNGSSSNNNSSSALSSSQDNFNQGPSLLTTTNFNTNLFSSATSTFSTLSSTRHQDNNQQRFLDPHEPPQGLQNDQISIENSSINPFDAVIIRDLGVSKYYQQTGDNRDDVLLPQ